MKERSIFSTVWFWLLIVGVVIILIAALLAAGFKEDNGWIWWIFILGLVLAFLGIVFAIVSWVKYPLCDKIVTTPVVIENKVDTISTFSTSSPIYTSTMSVPSSPSSNITRTYTNIPQSERGFLSTSQDLSSLAPLA